MLLDELEEENAFWVLCHVIEVVLPPDYYSDLTGALVDVHILKDCIATCMPVLCDHFLDVKFDVSTLCLKWFLCL